MFHLALLPSSYPNTTWICSYSIVIYRNRQALATLLGAIFLCKTLCQPFTSLSTAGDGFPLLL